MKDGICPKCDSEEVYKKSTGGYLVVPLKFGRASVPIVYICADCGYFEWYIEERDNLEWIRSNWQSANPKHKGKNDE